MGNHGASAAEWAVRKDYLGGIPICLCSEKTYHPKAFWSCIHFPCARKTCSTTSRPQP